MCNLFPEVEKTLVILVDVQERLIKAMDEDRYLPEITKAVEAFSALKIPTVVTEQYPRGLGHTVESLANVLPERTQIIEKSSFSCWGELEFAKTVASRPEKNLIILGMEAHVCVLQTVVEAIGRGYNVIIPQECVCSRKEENRQNGLELMREAGAVISNLETIAFGIMKNSKHSAFKTVSKLIV